MRRDEAPIAHAHRRGGGKDKARIGVTPEKATNTGRGGRCCAALAPDAQMDEPWFRIPEVSIDLTGGAFFFQWIPECINAQEPATEARLRGNDCTNEGNLIIPFAWALFKEPTVNVLKQEKKIQVLNALVEGCSIRSIERMTSVHRDTIMPLGVEIGTKMQEWYWIKKLLIWKLRPQKLTKCMDMWARNKKMLPL